MQRRNRPLSGAEIVVHFQRDFVIAVLFVGQQNAAVAGDVLAADDRAVFDDPSPARFVLAGSAMAGLSVGVPTFERLAVEEWLEAGLLLLGQSLRGDKNDRRRIDVSCSSWW